MIAPDPTLSLATKREIDAICLRFEAEWQQAGWPAVESYLAGVADPIRPALLRELLLLDIDYRQADGQTPQMADYSVFLPTYGSVVARVFRQVGLSCTSTSGSRQLGDYELLEEIARGGMGVIYRARQKGLDRIVALKMILAGRLAGEADVARFRREAEAAASLQHSNIVAVHEVGISEGQHYFSMDYVEGRSLAEIVRDGPLPAREAAQYVETMSHAIQYAHGKGILHRDLKPSNVLIDEAGQVKITDFGLASLHLGEGSLTPSDQILGTPGFMPPEQAASDRGPNGPASDVYSLGAVLYDLLTGRPPFQGQTPADTVLLSLQAEPLAPHLLGPKVPRDLETICLKCLAKDPQQRYETAQALADDLSRFLQNEPILARPVGPMQRLWRWISGHRVVTALATSSALMFLFLASAGPLAAWRYSLLARHEARARATSEELREELQSLLRDTLTTTVETLADLPAIDPLHEQLLNDTLDRHRRLLAVSPADEDLRLAVASGFTRLAKIVKLRFDQNRAASLAQEAVELLGGDSAVASTDPRLNFALSDALFQLGTITWSTEALEKSIVLSEHLARQDPADESVKLLLAWGRFYLAWSLLADGDLDRAAQLGQQVRESFQSLRAADPTNDEYLVGQSAEMRLQGCLHRERGEHLLANESFREAIDLCDGLTEKTLSQTYWKLGVCDLIRDYGESLCQLGRHAEAEQQLRRAMDNLQDIVGGFPDSTWANRSLAWTGMAFGDCLVHNDDSELAEQMYRRSIEAADHLHPDVNRFLEQAQAHYTLGRFLWRAGRTSEAHEELALGIEWGQQSNAPSIPARWFATCPDPTLRDSKMALQFARELPPGSADNMKLLGFAQYRDGLWSEARETLQAVAVADDEVDPMTAFYLSMASAQLNDRSTARHWYEQATDRIDLNDTLRVDILVAREEAEEVLRARLRPDAE